MGMINSEIKPFNATAFKGGEFVEISEADVSEARLCDADVSEAEDSEA